MPNLTNDQTEWLKDLIVRSDLQAIQFHEIQALLRDTSPGESDEKADVQLGYQTRVGDADFGVRAHVHLTAPSGEARATVAADYKLSEGDSPSEELVELFAREVGLMTLFPYLREAISSATARVFGEPFWLPVLQRGQVQADEPDGDEG